MRPEPRGWKQRQHSILHAEGLRLHVYGRRWCANERKTKSDQRAVRFAPLDFIMKLTQIPARQSRIRYLIVLFGVASVTILYKLIVSVVEVWKAL